MGTAAELLSLSASDVCGSETENRGSESGKCHCSSKGTFVPFEGGTIVPQVGILSVSV